MIVTLLLILLLPNPLTALYFNGVYRERRQGSQAATIYVLGQQQRLMIPHQAVRGAVVIQVLQMLVRQGLLAGHRQVQLLLLMNCHQVV